MQKIINLRDAQVSTATIEIRTLTVSNKQVTLAVFRQLIEEELINYDGNLNGVPWGNVNYHPDKCGDDRAHIHVVWQTGRDLRRARVYADPFYGKEFWVDEINTADHMLIRDFLRGRLTARKFKLEGTPVEIPSKWANTHMIQKFVSERTYHFSRDYSDQQEKAFEAHKKQCLAELDKRGLEGTYDDFKQAKFPMWINEWISDDKKYYHASEFALSVNACIDDANKVDARTLKQFWPVLAKAVHAEMQRRQRWTQQVANLQILPQLFIAV